MIQFNRIFLRVPQRDRQLAVGIPGAKFHYNVQEYSWPVNMVETVKRHFPDNAAQLQIEYDQFMMYYAREQAVLAQKRREMGTTGRTGGGVKYVKEIRQDAKLLADALSTCRWR